VTIQTPEQVMQQTELDAKRYRWLRAIGHEQLAVLAHYAGPELDSRIDAALSTSTQAASASLPAPPTVPTDAVTKKQARDAVKKMNKARRFPEGTDPCSRHVAIMAETLAKGLPYPMLDDEREHCAISLAATVEMLWEARSALASLPAAAVPTQQPLLRRCLEALNVAQGACEYGDMHPTAKLWAQLEDDLNAALSSPATSLATK
jgi:hypothetical protein